MLSIVKMDFDSDVEILDDGIKSEVIDIDENSEDKKDPNILNNVVHDLEQIPLVYTTKLCEMFIHRFVGMDPKEATARIIRESKPVFRTLPGPPKKGRKNRRRFSDLEKTLRRIYHSPKVLVKEEIHTEPETCEIQIDFNSVKSEVTDEPIVKVKTKVLEKQVVEKPELKDTCKYSELLKQCKPCRVLLPVLIGHGQVFHGGQLLEARKVRKPSLVSSSQSLTSDDEVPLITFPPDLLIERTSSSNKVKQGKITQNPESGIRPKIIEIGNFDQSQKKVASPNEIPQRLLRNGLLDIHDKFSNDHYFYFTDSESNLLDYFKNVGDKSFFETTHLHEHRYKINNCCWVRKDEFIQSLYPKVLIFPNSRFMRNLHPCKPDACTCCCRRKENFRKPVLDFTGDQPVTSLNQKSSEVDVIRDLEDEIDITIINIKKTPKLYSKEWLESILAAKRTNDAIKFPNSLIGKALNYTKPPPAKLTDNRRLVTLKKGDLLSNVIVFRYFAEDLIEIYEINGEGDVETYLKTACYGNTSQPDVKRLLKRRNVTTEAVCCWYKREEVISKLYKSKVLHPGAIKFVRTAHVKMPCRNKECLCCCKPKVKTEIKLDNITLPKRSLVTSSTLNIWKPAHVPQKDDDDCQITSVMTSPAMQPVKLNPTIQATVPVPPSLFVTDAVDNDELSKEVNTLITSILDRFKDVRLTINGDGKVAAALNTPVNTLSTVELKVLANILSFAQSQVNLLGSKVSSGASLSLSNIINLKVDDVQSNTTIDPNTVYKEFGKNINLNTAQKLPVPPTNVNMNTPLVLPHISTAPQPYTFFTDTMSVKNQQFNDAFSSFVNSKIDANTETVTPVIENVYSLKENENSEEDSSSTTVWYRKPAVQSSSAAPSNITATTNKCKKRNDGSKPETGQSKKLRVRSPTKLGTVTDNPPGIMTTANIPQQQFQIQQTPPVGGLMPGVYVLPNNNFIVPSLSQPQIINCMSSSSVQQPMLIINPLHNNGGTLIPTSTASGIQSKIPVILNSASTSQLINTESGNYITVEQSIPGQEATYEAGGITDNPDPLNDQEMDSAAETVCVLEDGGQITGNDGDMDIMDSDEEIELKYSPETNEVEGEEDCILGF